VTAAAALVIGYLLGGLPTADWFAARRKLDLRTAGSGNPGANNALRLGGRALGASVLAAEMAKGGAAVGVGAWLAGDIGMVLAGLGALHGNLYNPYRRLRGGQGLGIGAGILLVSLPAPGAVCILTAIGAVTLTRRSEVSALTALVALVTAAVLLPSGPWGVETDGFRLVLAGGTVLSVAPKQVRKLRRSDRPSLPAPG
jgi:acyl phosphate:glycerol-3-phosphate acyltransferase